MLKKTKKQTAKEIVQESRRELTAALADGSDKKLLQIKIREMATRYADELDRKITDRQEEMERDDDSHYLIYRVLGIKRDEGKMIDVYQNKGRFLYKYAGSFLEEAASLCFWFKNIDGCKTKVKNTLGQNPKTFEIDFLDGQNAIEIKWRDATTDGDHITKEHTRVKSIQSHGYVPIRVMFYYPLRKQAILIQNTLKTLYAGVKGEYHAGEDAWGYVENYTGYDLKAILEIIADERTPHES
jgi:type II restriction enzyme